MKLLCLASALLALRLAAQQPVPPPAAPEPPTHRFTVPLHDGQLEVGDLARALLRAYELDADAIPLPAARVDLRGKQGFWTLIGARVLLLRTVQFSRRLDEQQLVVTIDRARARAVRRDLRARLARLVGQLGGEDVAARAYELALPGDLEGARPLVVLVHGVESDAGEWDDLRAFLRQQGKPPQVATFDYPNDEAIERIAPELSRRLRALGSQPIVLVGHSMGGLVARAVVEDPALDPGTVRELVLIGTPNQGSNLAGFRFALEAADALQEAGGDEAFARALFEAALDHFRDGLGEAGGDLLPGSVCLQRLAARPRNAKVAYHVVLGTRSVLTREQLERLRRWLSARLEGNRIGRLVRPRLESWLLDLDELVDGRGDGAVSVARGQLPGVEPVLVPLDHVGLVRRQGLLGGIGSGAEQPVFALVARILAAR